jgi:thiamine biosynthesis lipoprotein
VEVDEPNRTVKLPPGVGLDFGGIAKGMAVDAALERLLALEPEQAAVEAGGDLRVHGLPPGQRSWAVAIELKEGYQTVSLYGGALATSSVSHRHWKMGGVSRHHLLDPRSGALVQNGLWSVSVVAARCVQADVAAKTAFVLGVDEGVGFLTRHRLAALMIGQDGQQCRVGTWLEEGDS